MEVTYFRPHKAGPEASLVGAVANTVPSLLQIRGQCAWIAGSLPIGAGIPDLVIVTCEPKVIALANGHMASAEILAYLRVVHRASFHKITERINRPHKLLVTSLNGLAEVNAIVKDSDVYSLSPEWREVLAEVVTIEAKIKNWKRAVQQASRNRIFAHRSFVALPFSVANRIQSEQAFSDLGIGLICVRDDGEVTLLRDAQRQQPSAWTYYYYLALMAATHLQT